MTFQPGQPVKIKPGTPHNAALPYIPRPAVVDREMAGGQFVIVRIDDVRPNRWVRVRAEDLEPTDAVRI